MKYEVFYTNRFKKDYALCKKRGLDIDILKQAVAILAETGVLPKQYKPHPLQGKYAGKMECHLQPDWLLVWEQNDSKLILLFTNTGTHSDLF